MILKGVCIWSNLERKKVIGNYRHPLIHSCVCRPVGSERSKSWNSHNILYYLPSYRDIFSRGKRKKWEDFGGREEKPRMNGGVKEGMRLAGYCENEAWENVERGTEIIVPRIRHLSVERWLSWSFYRYSDYKLKICIHLKLCHWHNPWIPHEIHWDSEILYSHREYDNQKGLTRTSFVLNISHMTRAYIEKQEKIEY